MIRNHIMISKKQLLDSDRIATSVGTSEVHEQRRKLRDIPCNDGVPKTPKKRGNRRLFLVLKSPSTFFT